jgi:tetratricopeptide (TPR) repeat protein
MAVGRQIGYWAASAAVMAILVVLQIHMGQSSVPEKKLEQFMYLPNGEYLQIASLGYQELIADVLWLEAIQVMGERKVSDTAGHWLYRAFDIITTLDPKFERAYEAGGLALVTLVVLPEESNRLMKKGAQHNPENWRLPFYLGINYYFELYDDAKAAEYVAQASRLPGAPEGLVSMAANLFASAKSAQQAVDLLIAAYQNTSDENAKKFLEFRLKIMITERDLQMLEQAIHLYQTRYARLPSRLEDLVEAGLLRDLPIEPSGGRYILDAETGTVTSSEMAERPKLTGKRRMH